jgi:putative mycofactocin binding protein MftB
MQLDAAYELDPQVSLRPEPFGALAYHFGTRRLSFLRSHDIVTVVEALDQADSVEAALRDAAIDEVRWPSFTKALATLEDSNMIRLRSADCAPVVSA